MVDTVRPLATLLATQFADGQTAGISAQDLRDLLVSSLGQTGWADYQDTTFTDVSPQALTAGVPNKIQIDGGVARTAELPTGVTALWDTADDFIIGPVVGSGLMVTFETTIRRASGNGAWEWDSWIDVGDPSGVPLYSRHYSVVGSDDKFKTWTTAAYCLDTWVANGGKIFIQPTVNAECYGSRVIIHQTHRGRGAYP